MVQYQIEELVAMTSNAIWELPIERCTIVFPDAVVESTTPNIQFSWYSWMLNREYGVVPLSNQLLPLKELSKGDDVKLLEKSVGNVYYRYIEDHPEEDPRQVYEDCMLYTMIAKNMLYDATAIRLNGYANGLNIMSFADVMLEPRFAENRANIVNTEESILDAIDFACNEIEDPQFKDNELARYLRRSMTQKTQAVQMYHVRGATTGINDGLYKEAILSPYVDGIRDAGFAAIETSQAARATFFQKSPMEKVEYFHRQEQLVMMNLHTVDGVIRIGKDKLLLESDGDCKTTERMEFKLRSKKDVEVLEGLLYYTNEDRRDRMMVKTNTHLVGSTVYVRTPLNCASNKRGHVCASCLGMYANTIPKDICFGLTSSSEMIARIVQSVLGVKHSEGTAELKKLTLTPLQREYFLLKEDRRSFYLQNGLRKTMPELLIDSAMVPDLSDVLTHKGDFEEADLMGAIPRLTLTYVGKDGIRRRQRLDTNLSSTTSLLSKEMLTYIRKHNFEIINDTYQINLSEWDFSKPILQLERKHLNMLDLLAQIQSFIKAGDDPDSKLQTKTLRNLTDKHEALKIFHGLINDQLKINLVHLALAIKATMCKGAYSAYAKKTGTASMELPLLHEPYRFGLYSDIMQGRSMGALMVFEKQLKVIHGLSAYVPEGRPPHPYDSFFTHL